jgi:hypothetical protein
MPLPAAAIPAWVAWTSEFHEANVKAGGPIGAARFAGITIPAAA